MLLILFSWIYIFLTSTIVGFSCTKWFQIKVENTAINSFIGLFFVTLFAGFWAIFNRINIEFHVVFLIICIFLFLKNKKEIINFLDFNCLKIKNLNTNYKVFIFVTFFFTLLKSATKPLLIDNETYYIQTIKWLNEYGFVNGLANLHIFLGQCSGWHITQSVYNLSFLYKNFNDINGYIFVLVTVFFIQKLQLFSKNNQLSYLIMGLFLLSNGYFFLFINSPSPDLPVYLFTAILFFYFINNEETNSNNLPIVVLFTFFILLIKPIFIFLIILPIFLILKNKKSVQTNIFFLIFTSISVLLLYVIKNSILTGYPLFPTQNDFHLNLSHKIPSEIMEINFRNSRLYRTFLTKKEFDSSSNFQIFIKWLFYNKVYAIINCLAILGLFLIPFFMKKYKLKKEYWIIYSVISLQIILFIFTSPQFRFFIHFIFFECFLILSLVLQKIKNTNIILIFSILPIVFLSIIPFSIFAISNDKLWNIDTFTVSEIIFPHKNSGLSTSFQKEKIGNLTYFSPDSNTYIWMTGDGNLPCVNKKQIELFKEKTHFIPQLISTNLKDGFYSKSTKNE